MPPPVVSRRRPPAATTRARVWSAVRSQPPRETLPLCTGGRPSRMTLRRSRVAEPRRIPGGTEPASDRVQTPPCPAARSLRLAHGRGDVAWPARAPPPPPPPRSRAPPRPRLDSTAAARARGELAPAQPDWPAAVLRRRPPPRTTRPSLPRVPLQDPLEGFRATAE